MDEDQIQTYRELTEGLHKLGLSVHGISVRLEDYERRLERVETTVSDGSNPLAIRVSKIEDAVASLAEDIDENHILIKKQLRDTESQLRESIQKSLDMQIAQSNNQTTLKTTKISSRATILAAWIGAAAGILAVIVTLVLALI